RLPRRLTPAGGSPSVAGTQSRPVSPPGGSPCPASLLRAKSVASERRWGVTSIFEAALGLPVRALRPHGILLTEGERSDKLYILKSGDLEVVRNGSVVAGFTEHGAVIGEMSALLDQPHSATVRTRAGAEVYVVDDPDAFLDRHPPVA